MRNIYLKHQKSVQLKRLVRKLERLVQSGQFKGLARRKQWHLLRRFSKLCRQLRLDLNRLALKPAVLALLVSSGVVLTQQKARAQAPSFGTQVQNPFNLTSVGYECKPSLVDIDDDGDLDMFAGDDDGDINFFLNTGSATAPSFDTLQLNPFGLANQNANYVSVHLQDMDDDGDYDLWYGDDSFQMVYFENVGDSISPAFGTPVVNPFGLTSVYGQYEAKITTGDMDNDGDFDMLVGANYGNLYYYQNTGTVSAPAFAAPQTNPFGLTNAAMYYAAPSISDIDNDGDFDVAVNNNYGTLLFFENTGTILAPAFANPVNNPFGITSVTGYSVAIFADLDGDGDEDVIQGEGYGNFMYQPDTVGGGGSSNIPPQISIIANDTVCDNDTLEIAFLASDPNSDPITVTAISTNQAVIPDANIQITGIDPNFDLIAVPVGAGNTEIIVTVMDSLASRSDTVAVNVETCVPNSIPVITPPANDTVCDGDTLTVPFMADDADMDPLLVTAYSDNQAVIPDANIFINGTQPNYTISVVPIAQGIANITIEADDGEDIDSTGFEVEAVDCSVSIDAANLTEDLKVYPNPASDRIRFELGLQSPADRIKVEVLDLAGKVLVNELFLDPAMKFEGILDVSNLAQGVYFLRLSNTEFIANRKIMVE